MLSNAPCRRRNGARYRWRRGALLKPARLEREEDDTEMLLAFTVSSSVSGLQGSTPIITHLQLESREDMNDLMKQIEEKVMWSPCRRRHGARYRWRRGALLKPARLEREEDNTEMLLAFGVISFPFIIFF